MAKQKLLYLESLRGIAALVVAIFHAKYLYSDSVMHNAFVINGYLMVDFFFVLSGFVIAYSYYDKLGETVSLFQFQLQRFLRLYPLHVLTLLVALSIETAKYLAATRFGMPTTEAPFAVSDGWAFLSNLALTQGLTHTELTFNGPSWSISTEFYTYLLFAVVFILGRFENARRCIYALLILACGYYLFSTPDDAKWQLHEYFRCVYAFMLGVLVHRVSNARADILPSWIGSALLVVSVIAVMLNTQIQDAWYPIIFALLLYFLVNSGVSNTKRLLEQPMLVYLGTISYGIYMWHTAVWWVMKNALQFLFKIPVVQSSSGLEYLQLHPVVGWVLVALGVGVVLILSTLSYRWLEKPVNDLRHRLK